MFTERNDRERDRLAQVLDRLHIGISRGGDGRFTVYSTSEPLFCFERDTEEECRRVTVETLRSYIENFYEISEVEIVAETVPEQSPVIPIERLARISRIRPSVHRKQLFGGN
jgi:hypothetical protein